MLGAADIRRIADDLGVRPTKQLGQNFVIDANTVRRIARLAEVSTSDHVLEVGPGIGSLTLALLPLADAVTAVEIDGTLARALPVTVAQFQPDRSGQLTVVHADALHVRSLDAEPTVLVANLPYNVAVPVLLHVLECFPRLERALVMVQAEVADRLAAEPGTRVYGVPSVKARWYGSVRSVGRVPPSVFWPVPRVDSGLVLLTRRAEPQGASRSEVFALIDAAFAQRRKGLRSALASWAGSPVAAERLLRAAGVDPTARGETLDVGDFVRIAAERRRLLDA